MKIVVVLVGIAMAAGVLWIAGELHYNNCVIAAGAQSYSDDPFAFLWQREGRSPPYADVARYVRGCSRLPF